MTANELQDQCYELLGTGTIKPQQSDDATVLELPLECPNCKQDRLILEILTGQFSIRAICLSCDSEAQITELK